MPGPGVELIGEEEIAEVMQVLRNRALSRYGSADDPPSGPRCARSSRRSPVWPASATGSGCTAVGQPACGLDGRSRDRARRRGHRPGLHVRRVHLGDRLRAGAPVLAEVDAQLNLDPADVEARITLGRGRSWSSICSERRRGSTSSRLSPIATGSRSSRTAPRRSVPPTRGRGSAASAPRVFSFNEFKTITCGDGGMIVTDDEELYGRLLRDPRPGPRAEPPRVEVGRAAVPRHELPHDRAVRGRPAGPGAAADRSATGCAPTRPSFKSVIADLPGLASGDRRSRG